MTATDRAQHLVRVAAAAADAIGGDDLVGLDVSEPLPFVDVFFLVTGHSERNVIAIAREIEERLGDEGADAVRREGMDDGRWVLLDFGDLVVHVFHEEDRMYYGLERLWKDCPVVPLRLPARESAR